MKSQRFLLVLCALLLVTAFACGDDEDDGGAGTSGMGGDGDGDGDECEDAPTYDEVSAFDKCTMCHSSELSGDDRMMAPADHNFDTYEGATEFLDHVLEEAEEGDMPPAASGITITEAERADLVKWAECGGPE